MSTSHSDYLKHIHQQRHELGKLVTMAKDIHHMINGLKGIEQLDDISIKLPEEIELFINQYMSSIKDNSTNELKELIRSLDQIGRASCRERV